MMKQLIKSTIAISFMCLSSIFFVNENIRAKEKHTKNPQKQIKQELQKRIFERKQQYKSFFNSQNADCFDSKYSLEIFVDNFQVYKDQLSRSYAYFIEKFFDNEISKSLFAYLDIRTEEISNIKINFTFSFDAISNLSSIIEAENEEESCSEPRGNFGIQIDSIIIYTKYDRQINVNHEIINEFLSTHVFDLEKSGAQELSYLLQETIENDPIFIIFPEFLFEIMSQKLICTAFCKLTLDFIEGKEKLDIVLE